MAKIASQNNYIVGLVGRRTQLLDDLKEELTCESFIKNIDVAKPDEAMNQLKALISEMGVIDLIVISAGKSWTIGILGHELKNIKNSKSY